MKRMKCVCLRFICIKLSWLMALKTDLSSSVRSKCGETLGAFTCKSLCQVMSVLATRVINMEPTCNKSRHDSIEYVQHRLFQIYSSFKSNLVETITMYYNYLWYCLTIHINLVWNSSNIFQCRIQSRVYLYYYKILNI